MSVQGLSRTPLLFIPRYLTNILSKIISLLRGAPRIFLSASGLPDNSWKIHGSPWAPMRNHGDPWVPMGSHGFPWVSMGSHGSHGTPWGPHGAPMASMENSRMSEIMDFNETHYSVRQNGGSTGSSSIRNVFPLHPVTSKRPESPYGANNFFWPKIQFFSFSAYRTPIGPL